MIDTTKQLFYTSLQLPKREPFDAYQLEREFVLPNLGVVNIFVGANNCGKSRFLRALFRTKDFGFKTSLFREDAFRHHLLSKHPNFNTQHQVLFDQLGRVEVDPPLMNECFKDHSGFFLAKRPFKAQLKDLTLHGLDKARRRDFPLNYGYSDLSRVFVHLEQFFASYVEASNQANWVPTIGNEKAFYIPILRGMRPFDGQENCYASRTAADYFQDIPGLISDAESGATPKLFTGLELYQSLKKQLLGEPEEREAVRAFEAFLQRQFFDGRPVTLIPREGEKVVHVKIGTEKQLPIHLLGDGLQNLIIIAYPIFMEKERRLFFIEEPDLSMHPGMQRALLEVMIQHRQHQYFLTTHSNHLLDMSSEFRDVSVYLFSKEFAEGTAKFKIRQASSPDANILMELGVRNSSVFLTNATIWVEGFTDRLYLKAYLQKFLEQKRDDVALKQIREDYHYSFVEYQGSNITHWTFDNKDQSEKIKANYLCGRSFLIADGDVSEKGTRREDYKKMLGDRFFILACKEIENLIPAEVLKELVKEEFKKQGQDVEKIAYSKYSASERGLGKYLDSFLDKKLFGSETGTLKSKVNFCEKAVEIMARNDFQWQLTPPLNELCEKIYKFIERQNS